MERRRKGAGAVWLGLPDCGLLRTGMAADVVCLDAASVRDMATYDDPRRYPEGIPYVVVNGKLVIDQGRHTGNLPGRALRKKTRPDQQINRTRRRWDRDPASPSGWAR